MTDEEWEGWEEWLQHPLTRRLTEALAARAGALKSEFTNGLWWQEDPDPNQSYFVDLRARALVCEEFAGLDRETLSKLMEQS